MMVVCQTTSVRLFVEHEPGRYVELRFPDRKARAEARTTYQRHGFVCSTMKPKRRTH